jgi:hypothetical protein
LGQVEGEPHLAGVARSEGVIMPGDDVPNFSIPADLIGKIDLTRPDWLLALRIDGIEVTQGIQWYSAAEHLTDPADRGPDNGVTLVANKPAWVRVYAGGLVAHNGVTGSISLQRHDALGMWVDRYSPVQQNPYPVNYDPSTPYATMRGSLGYTLNFVIPADQMHGLIRLAVSITSDSGQVASATYEIDATLKQTLQVRGIPIRYWGADASGNQVQLGPTTSADLVSTATWPMLTYPVENVPSVSLAGIFTWSESLAGAATTPGGCSTGWNDLLFWLQVAKVVDGNRPGVIYYGLLPAGTPDGPVTGCDSDGASAGKATDGVTMAHEMGHYQGFAHAPCGNVGTADPNYPAYEPYDSVGARTASIGEFGLDVSTGAIFDPASAKDYMSYCGPQWTSLYHYRLQVRSSWFNPRYVAENDVPPWWQHRSLYRPYDVRRDLPRPGPVQEYPVHELVERQLEPALAVTGLLTDGELEIRSVLAIEAVTLPSGDGEERLELLDKDGSVIRGAQLTHSQITACGGGGGTCGGRGCGGCAGRSKRRCPAVVQAVVPHHADAVALRVVRGDDVLWQRDATGSAPVVRDLTAQISEGQLALSWRVTPSETSETHLRRSYDGGRTWGLLELALAGTATAIPLEVLPPGRQLIHVVVADGFHSTTSEAVEVEIPERGPSACIHWPLDTATVGATGLMRLWGTGMSARGEALASEMHSWTIDDQPAGVGRDIWVEPPDTEGEHTVVLSLRDAHGEARASSRFWVTWNGQPPRLLHDG